MFFFCIESDDDKSDYITVLKKNLQPRKSIESIHSETRHIYVVKPSSQEQTCSFQSHELVIGDRKWSLGKHSSKFGDFSWQSLNQRKLLSKQSSNLDSVTSTYCKSTLHNKTPVAVAPAFVGPSLPIKSNTEASTCQQTNARNAASLVIPKQSHLIQCASVNTDKLHINTSLKFVLKVCNFVLSWLLHEFNQRLGLTVLYRTQFNFTLFISQK